MADVEFQSYDGGYPAGPGSRLTRMVNLGGAVCSVALILGLGVWGYKLAMRDVTGIPVFRAVEGPLRLAPQDPGGTVASHQGLSVNAVAAAGTALPLPESLRLAPRPVELVAEDVAGLADLPMSDAPAAPLDIAALDLGVETAPVAPAEQDAVAAALAEALADEGAALPPAEETLAALETPVDPLDGSVTEEAGLAAALATSPRPRSRPAGGAVAAVTDVAQTSSAPAAAELDPAAVPAGASLVQLGAFDDQSAARGEWSRLSDKFPDLLAGKSMVVQAAQSGGRTFYRLRAAGFGGPEDARQFCVALLSGNATCIPVTHR